MSRPDDTPSFPSPLPRLAAISIARMLPGGERDEVLEELADEYSERRTRRGAARRRRGSGSGGR